MNFIKITALSLAIIFMFGLCGCNKVDKNFGVVSETDTTESVKDNKSNEELPEITSLDNKMAKYFDISRFDEENYADIYLGKKYEIKAEYAGTVFEVPTTLEAITVNGWQLVSGSDYDENSLVYARESIELKFKNQDGAEIVALFYNSSNSSVRLSKCDIVKFHIDNQYLKNKKDYDEFNINGVVNTSVVTDIIEVLGTPSHFYKKSENSYYFDYFLQKRDRRNKIRIYVDLEDDVVTAVEFAKYK